ncbi:TIGR04282 family arsenosugar biosynthesis glycosyltransferase [Nocardioides coralli]|uniref:TIGR04282 family arsenosugar biosynthesis glycosyltransferase n=1 Tax=Nocardioides coralli TaxID=2872154 RepID=UPI001CA4301F|nr:DUF2064 domain-containing protein [Nocardioides coralli]QZY30423.1 DUF2064 domain-containing protein [Nocardioides coralli]
MSAVQCLVVAKAPVPGEAKTRLAADIGPAAAAELAAAALLDTLDACRAVFPVEDCHLALAGDLAAAPCGPEVRSRAADWNVFAQRGGDFAARLADAHRRVGGPVVQIGMDTPQVTGEQLANAAGLLRDHDAVLGPAEDGGWWLLGLRDAAHAAVLREVPMSTPETGDLTLAALRRCGLDVAATATLRDVDELPDATVVAGSARGGRFAATWAQLVREAAT